MPSSGVNVSLAIPVYGPVVSLKVSEWAMREITILNTAVNKHNSIITHANILVQNNKQTDKLIRNKYKSVMTHYCANSFFFFFHFLIISLFKI